MRFTPHSPASRARRKSPTVSPIYIAFLSVPLVASETAKGDQADQGNDQARPEAPGEDQDDSNDYEDAAQGNSHDAPLLAAGPQPCSRFASSCLPCSAPLRLVS